jgi:HK97 family phage portal protein
MGLMTRIAGQSRGATSFAGSVVSRSAIGVPTVGMIPPLGATPSAAGLLVSQSTAMSISPIFACVNIIAKDVARCAPSLYREDDNGIHTPVTGNPVNDLFLTPNRIQTWFEFMQQMTVAMMLRSNAYAAILRDKDGYPIELIPINPDAVLVLEASDGSVFYNVNRLGLFQIAVLSGFAGATIPAEDMLHIRDFTFNILVAPSRIGLMRDSIGVTMGLEQQAARWMANSARPSGVLQTDKTLTDSAAARLRQQWENMVRGIQNVGNTAVLEEGLKWQQITLDAATLEFIQQRNFQVEEASRIYGVPLHKLGREIQGRLTPTELEQMYVNNTVTPILDNVQARLERALSLHIKGIRVKLDEQTLLRADIMTRRNATRLGVLSGVITQNEGRADEGRMPIAGGDVLLVPSNTAAQGSDATGTAPDGAGKPAGDNLPDPGAGTSGNQPSAVDSPSTE